MLSPSGLVLTRLLGIDSPRIGKVGFVFRFIRSYVGRVRALDRRRLILLEVANGAEPYSRMYVVMTLL